MKKQTPKPIRLSKRVQDYAAEQIAAGIVRGTNRFLVAACTVLKQDYGWSDKQIIEFTEKTRDIGYKYLRIAPNGQTINNDSNGTQKSATID